MTAPPPILVVEDNDEDFETLRLAFANAGVKHPLFRTCDGEEALGYLAQQGRFAPEGAAPRPGIILLDLNLAGMDGRRTLERLKADARFKSIPVFILSTSDNPKDVNACYQHGASGYLLKPVDLERFERMVACFKGFWLEFVILPEQPREAVLP